MGKSSKKSATKVTFFAFSSSILLIISLFRFYFSIIFVICFLFFSFCRLMQLLLLSQLPSLGRKVLFVGLYMAVCFSMFWFPEVYGFWSFCVFNPSKFNAFGENMILVFILFMFHFDFNGLVFNSEVIDFWVNVTSPTHVMVMI